jgi:hypothetical protein
MAVRIRHPGAEAASPWQCAFGIRVPTVPYPLERPDAAVRDLAHDRITGAAVVRVARV